MITDVDYSKTGQQISPQEVFDDFLLKKLLRRAGVSSETKEALDELRLVAHHKFLQPLLHSVNTIINKPSQSPATISTDVVLLALNMTFRPSTIYGKLSIYGYRSSRELQQLVNESIQKLLNDIHSTLTLNTVALNVLHDMTIHLGTILMKTAWAMAQTNSTTDQTNNTTPQRKYEKEVVGELLCGSWKSELLIATNETAEYQQSPPVMITDTHLTAAVNHLMQNNKLAQFANNEGNKAVINHNNNNAMKTMTLSPILLHALLQLTSNSNNSSIDMIEEEAWKHLTLEAMVYLTGVIQFVLQEILTLAGQTCLSFTNHNNHEMTSQHLLFAIRGDEELHLIFPGILRDAGVLPTSSLWVDCYPGQSFTALVLDTHKLQQYCHQQMIINHVDIEFDCCQMLQEVLEHYLIEIARESYKKTNHFTE